MRAVEEMMCVVCVEVTKGHSRDGFVLASTLCKYDLRKGYLFVRSWARVRRVRRGSICRMFVFMSVVVTMWGFVGKFVV